MCSETALQCEVHGTWGQLGDELKKLTPNLHCTEADNACSMA